MAPWAEALLVVAVYVVATVVIFQPLLSDPVGSMPDPRALFEGRPADAAFKDGFLLAWLYAWGWHALGTAPASLYDANAFHPYANSLGLSEHSIGKVLTAGPVYGLTGNPVLAYEVDLVLSFALSGAALYAYLRHAGVGSFAALITGAVYAFCPARLGIYFHTHLLGWMYLPLALLLLDRTLTKGTVGSALGVFGFVLVQCLCSYYLAFMTLIGVGLYGAVFALVARREVRARGFWLAVGAGVAACAALSLISQPYLENRALGVLPDFARPDRASFPLAHSSDPWRAYLLPVGKAYLGWLPLAAAILALVGTRVANVERRAATWAAAAIVGVAWVLSLGPTLPVGGHDVTLPFRWLAAVVPGFSSMRAPDRFGLLVMFGFSILVGFGLDRAAVLLGGVERGRRWWPAVAGVAFLAVVAVEFRIPDRSFPGYPFPTNAAALPLHVALAELPEGAVAEFPFHGSMGLDAAQAMVRSTANWRPLVNGKSGYEPRGRDLLLGLVGRIPVDPSAFRTFVRLTGVRYVIVDLDRVGPMQASAWRSNADVRWVREAEGLRLGVVDPSLTGDLVDVLRSCSEPAASSVEPAVPASCEELARLTAG
ncbi:MAG: hypothetical protein P8R42_09435 [Candidatus Binatia bacterium]|nr:hypothetical protein [Candidatus Binatia bacterium]